ncbi:5-hydroxyisourate hydrolase [Jatrophihabitans sp. GAS493]|uniref:hydroxyisourate hydrolase n=1 Tax=Jatrophihabitans sp. GAS493 TaxID=1907575 RepID=UPI000BB87991|nr:hydroxyisourate hydrolase [Jatrophihabitans sp. GAS493]SOD71151.1 5-hydroxyisourate hydrolase [Jatrophihabitans sp. GAS493]
MSLSTHVLNSVTGRPVAGMPVLLEQRGDDGWRPIEQRTTSEDGRIADLAPDLGAGIYRLTFDVEQVFAENTFYPEVAIAFRVRDASQHYHVPVLLSPYAYSTYRGS